MKTLVLVLNILGLALSSYLLISKAPWRSFEIGLILLISFIGYFAVFRLSKKNGFFKNLFFVLSLFVLCTTALVFAFLSFKNVHFNLPNVDDYISQDINKLGNDQRFSHLISSIKNNELLPEAFGITVEGSKEDVLERAAHLIKHEYVFFNDYAPYVIQDPSWKEDPFNDISWNFRLHKMSFLVTLVRAYKYTGDLTYLKNGEQLIFDWIDDNSTYIHLPPSEFTWNDHSTAFRLMNWLFFLNTWLSTSLADTKKTEIILRSMLGHVNHLAHPKFYKRNHNHGIDQDRALLAFSKLFPAFDSSQNWEMLSLNRLQEQLDFQVSNNGIHLEHSPHYHLFGLSQILKIRSFLDIWKIEHPTYHTIERLIPLMVAFIPHLIKPDGNVVQVGDTPYESINKHMDRISPYIKKGPLLNVIIGNGDTAFINSYYKVYEKEGYVIIRDVRSKQTTFQESFYLFFTAAANKGRGHRQSDDLSFVLSSCGQEILIDPGVYSYKRNYEREYVLSPSAHNTVVVENNLFNGWDTNIEGYASTDSFILIKAKHENFKDFRFERTLLFIKPNQILIIDRYQPSHIKVNPTVHRFHQLFHFNPELTINIEGTSGIITNPSENSAYLAKIIQNGITKPIITQAKGGSHPMQGWHSVSHGKLVPAPVLISTLEGSEAVFTTTIEINCNDSIDASDNVSNFTISGSGDFYQMRWKKGKSDYSGNLDLRNISFQVISNSAH